MFLAVAALLLHPLAMPQGVVAAGSQIETVAVFYSANGDAYLKPVSALAAEGSGPAAGANPTPGSPETSEPLEIPEFRTSDASFAPEPAAPEPGSPAEPANPVIHVVMVGTAPQGREEAERQTLHRREWFALSFAQSSAATFDAWSTRQAISGGATELNPMLRPFAGNGSLYAAVQVGPLLLDYVGHRMMTSQHGWARHTCWVPQTVGTALSLASGAHNLSVVNGGH